MSLYQKRGVSAQKEEVHKATKKLEQGLFPNAFCKVYPDYLGKDESFVNVMHADGAGTKSILAYLYWKETGDISVWKGIAQDACVMNLDDLLCVGIFDDIIFNSTIDRNKNLIPGEVLEQIINGTQDFFMEMKKWDVNIHYLGGETADVGDVVRTIAVNGTMSCRWPKKKLITNEKIKPGDVIVGFSSSGKATYEPEYNSGIGSNGLTSARHDVLSSYYADHYKESFDNTLDKNVVYIGSNRMTDVEGSTGVNIGKLLLSPTRTFAPVMKKLLEDHFDKINGLVHDSGGGQTKCMKYVPGVVKVIKDNLFTPPPIFDIIKKNSNSNNREMYEVFNMGCRLEIYCNTAHADIMITSAREFNIDAQVIGRVEAASKKELLIRLPDEDIMYAY
jgi:phosphoribosylformylglycinamidine cyclo-ligase